MLRFSPSMMTLSSRLPIPVVNGIVVLLQLNTIVPPPAEFAAESAVRKAVEVHAMRVVDCASAGEPDTSAPRTASPSASADPPDARRDILTVLISLTVPASIPNMLGCPGAAGRNARIQAQS